MYSLKPHIQVRLTNYETKALVFGQIRVHRKGIHHAGYPPILWHSRSSDICTFAQIQRIRWKTSDFFFVSEKKIQVLYSI